MRRSKKTYTAPAWLLLFFFFLSACNTGFEKEAELYKWMADESNGLIVHKNYGSISMTMKSLPVDFLVYKELKGQKSYTRQQADSLREAYQQSYTFLLTIDFKEGKSGDNVLMYGLSSPEEYRERISALNFGLDQYIYMENNKEELLPVLWTLENTYTAGNKRTLYVVFPRLEEDMEKQIDVVFNDELFHTGISRFRFDKEKLNKIPEINFWNY